MFFSVLHSIDKPSHPVTVHLYHCIVRRRARKRWRERVGGLQKCRNGLWPAFSELLALIFSALIKPEFFLKPPRAERFWEETITVTRKYRQALSMALCLRSEQWNSRGRGFVQFVRFSQPC